MALAGFTFSLKRLPLLPSAPILLKHSGRNRTAMATCAMGANRRRRNVNAITTHVWLHITVALNRAPGHVVVVLHTVNIRVHVAAVIDRALGHMITVIQ